MYFFFESAINFILEIDTIYFKIIPICFSIIFYIPQQNTPTFTPFPFSFQLFPPNYSNKIEFPFTTDYFHTIYFPSDSPVYPPLTAADKS